VPARPGSGKRIDYGSDGPRFRDHVRMPHAWNDRDWNIAADPVEDLREPLWKKQFVLATDEDPRGLFDGPNVSLVVTVRLEVLLQPERIGRSCGLDAGRYGEGQYGQAVKAMNAEEIEDGEPDDSLHGDAIPGVVLGRGLLP